MDNDTSWCPVCDRAIQPKRYQVPIPTQPPPPPPSSPVRRNQQRLKTGLVNGTGRGLAALKSSQLQPIRYRTVIDQGPTPLYCSDECHSADLRRNSGIKPDFNPHQHQSSPSSSSSVNSTVSMDSFTSLSSAASPQKSQQQQQQVSPSLATLAKVYNWPPLPPPAPVLEEEDQPSLPSPANYDNGILMNARRIKAELTLPPPKRDARGDIIPEPRKVIPGWTDGSNNWRSSIYNLTSPDSSSPPPQHKSFATRGTRGVQSTLSQPRQQSSSSSSPHPTTSISPADVKLLDSFNKSFRHSSRLSPPSETSSLGSSSFSPRKERPLVHPVAEGQLLVRPVTLRVNSNSSLANQRCSSHPVVRSSHLERGNSQSSDTVSSLPTAHSQRKRATVETRSWSYDNVKTYPMMRVPEHTRTEKRKEIQVVDGEEVEVEVEVKVPEKIKRLFLFEHSIAPPS
ncbi:hypothetical protein H0H93_009371 [Arthromyces matolae]|nr:hypothetical protein H0H93_009371 [Arthromyces matolae]